MGTIINVYAMPVFLKEEYLGLLVFEQSLLLLFKRSANGSGNGYESTLIYIKVLKFMRTLFVVYYRDIIVRRRVLNRLGV